MNTDSRVTLASVGALETGELLSRYARGVENLDQRILKLSDEDLDSAFRADAGVGRWSARVLVGHLADAEMVLVGRMRRVVAEDNPVLTVWDEDAFIDGGVYWREGAPLPIAGSIAVAHTLRRWTSEWLGWLEADAWSRSGLHPEAGAQTLRDIVAYATWHLEHHAWFLRAKVEWLASRRG